MITAGVTSARRRVANVGATTMINAMVDIEALGNQDNGLIVQIGAVKFDPEGEGYSDPFLQNIEIQSALNKGALVEGKTIRWWFEQSQEAREGLFKPAPLPETAVLEMFRVWYNRIPKTSGIWANGSNYDLRHLDAAYGRYGQRPPWHYKDERDMRTLLDLTLGLTGKVPEWGKSDLPKHNGLADAICQAVAVQNAFNLLRTSGPIPTYLYRP